MRRHSHRTRVRSFFPLSCGAERTARPSFASKVGEAWGPTRWSSEGKSHEIWLPMSLLSQASRNAAGNERRQHRLLLRFRCFRGRNVKGDDTTPQSTSRLSRKGAEKRNTWASKREEWRRVSGRRKRQQWVFSGRFLKTKQRPPNFAQKHQHGMFEVNVKVATALIRREVDKSVRGRKHVGLFFILDSNWSVRAPTIFATPTRRRRSSGLISRLLLHACMCAGVCCFFFHVTKDVTKPHDGSIGGARRQ